VLTEGKIFFSGSPEVFEQKRLFKIEFLCKEVRVPISSVAADAMLTLNRNTSMRTYRNIDQKRQQKKHDVAKNWLNVGISIVLLEKISPIAIDKRSIIFFRRSMSY
jgi:hypothetical protein